MSYGVLASKTGQVLVEATSGNGGGDSDLALDKFHTVWGGMWVPGRLTLTRLNLTFIPSRMGSGVVMTSVSLRDITRVEVDGGRVTKTISVRTPRHVLRIRMMGASALADPLVRAVEEAATRAPRRV